MTQHKTKSTLEKERLQRELYLLLSEGLSKDGEDDRSLYGSEVLYYGDVICERTGLYY